MRANLTVLFFPARLGLRWADGGPDVVRLSPLALVPSSAGTTSPGSKGPEAGPAWCLPPRNPLFLRRRTPRPPNNWARRRAGRGAALPTSPYSFVGEHHVPRAQGVRGEHHVPQPECPTACRDKKSRQPQVPLGLPPSPPIRKYPPLHSSRRLFPSLFSLASAAV